jgi:hypothetical protein
VIRSGVIAQGFAPRISTPFGADRYLAGIRITRFALTLLASDTLTTRPIGLCLAIPMEGGFGELECWAASRGPYVL